MLMNRGNFWATVQPVSACIRDRVITWPRSVATILALNRRERPSEISNHWYQFMPLDSSHVRDACHYDSHGWAGNLMGETVGTSPVFNQIKSDGYVIRTFIRDPSDAGKTETWYGIDTNGQTIRTARSDGTVQDGVQVTLTNPYVDTPTQIRRVTRVVRDVTNYAVNCYQADSSGNLLDLAQYDPEETRPEYITTRLTGSRGWNWGNFGNGCNDQISALVKLQFIPFTYPNDLVQIDNEDAIRDMVLSIRKKEQGDMAEAQQYELSALRELNKQMQNRFPIEQFQVSFRPFGSARLQKITRGFI